MAGPEGVGPAAAVQTVYYLRPGRQCSTLIFPRTGFIDDLGNERNHWDRSTVFYNPFREVWVYGIRDYEQASIGRYRRYWEHKDALAGARWEEGQPPFWVVRIPTRPPGSRDPVNFTILTPSLTKVCCSDCSTSGAASRTTAPSPMNLYRLQPGWISLEPPVP